MSFQDEFADLITKTYPGISASRDELLGISKIATPHVLNVDKKIWEQAQQFISLIFKIRQSKYYQDTVLKNAPDIAKFDPKNYSVLMTFDFHVLEDGSLKLIEINTNGASSLIVDLLLKYHNRLEESTRFCETLRDSFFTEAKLFNKSVSSIALIDENYKKQNSYVEFLIFLELFKKWGLKPIIGNPDEITFDKMDFVYNRLTDFYFQNPYSKNLQDFYLNKSLVVSPNPHEYHLLANKNRLVDLCDDQFLNSLNLDNTDKTLLRSIIPDTKSFRSFSSIDDLWTVRKKYFFKPGESFGGKGAFKGESISRKLLGELFSKDYIAQEFAPPGIWQGYKWDLRFYAYRDTIQLSAARIYKGQTTNFQQEGTGIAVVKFA